jgi:hypothetical protein
MSKLNFRKNALEAAIWLGSGQFIDDGAELFSSAVKSYNDLCDGPEKGVEIGEGDFLKSPSAHIGSLRIKYPDMIVSSFSSEELLALQGMPQSDGSWRKLEPSGATYFVSAERVTTFKDNTHMVATIMCDMLDKLRSGCGVKDKADLNSLHAEGYDALPSFSEYKKSRVRVDLVQVLVCNYNSFIALNGDPLRDGSWCMYDESRNMLHTLSASLVKQFMDHTHRDATIMCDMLETEKARSNILCSNSDIVASADGESVSQPTSRKDLYERTSSSGPPSFLPSVASVPHSVAVSENIFVDLIKCISDEISIQSFWADLSIICRKSSSVQVAPVITIRDEALHVPPFDESLYCQIVLENHKYSLAELYDKEAAESDRRASKGMKLGAIYGLFTLNPLVPFFASSQARLTTPRHKKIEELIPDPRLLFLQDSYSLLAMTQAGTALPRMRRMILHPVVSGAQVFFRVLPAVLTQDAVIPCQVFSFGGNYFLRPICAGISHEQPNYNARKIHRQYYHLRADGSFVDTGTRVEVKGGDIDAHRYKLFKFTCDTRELEYYYIDYATEPGHVF